MNKLMESVISLSEEKRAPYAVIIIGAILFLLGALNSGASYSALCYYIPAILLILVGLLLRPRNQSSATLIVIRGFREIKDKKTINGQIKEVFKSDFPVSKESGDPLELYEHLRKEVDLNIIQYIPDNTEKYVLGYGRIPFLVAYGYVLRDYISSIKFIETFDNSDKQPLILKKTKESIVFQTPYNQESIGEGGSSLILAISISCKIDKNCLPKYLNGTLIELVSNDIDFGKITSKNDLDVITKIFRDLVTKSGSFDSIHLFLAAPTSVAIKIGMIYQEGTMPTLYVYNYDGNIYNYRISINGSNGFEYNSLDINGPVL